MRAKFFVLTLPLAGITLLLLGACAGAKGAGSPRAQSSGTPVNPFTNPGGADTPTAATTGAQPRSF